MTYEVVFPGSLRVRAGDMADTRSSPSPDWGVYADECWRGWPGVVLDWPHLGLPADDAAVVSAVSSAVGRAHAGQDVLVGGLGGGGRTGTILAMFAIACGVPAELARSWVRRHYHSSAVETEDQNRWIIEVAGEDQTLTDMGTRTRSRQIDAHYWRIRRQTEAALSHRQALPTLAWAVPDELAVTQRPLRAHPDPQFGASRQDLPASARGAIDAWIESIVGQGIRSAIVLTSNKELFHYEAPTGRDGGLLALYARAGLEVVHMPADDPAHDVTAKAAFDESVDDIARNVAGQLERLPLPAVLHCSAAIDRSPPVAARVAFQVETTRR